MKWTHPPLTILIVTYDRPQEIRTTIRTLHDRAVSFYPGPTRWHIADDGTSNNYVAELLHDFQHLDVSHTITNRKGWGANVNKALQSITTDYIYLNEDDYVPRRDIDLASGVALLEAETDLGIVRYDGVAGHTLNLGLRESKTGLGVLNYCRISKHSPHLNVYSHRPHLRHRRLHDMIGLYKEGLSLGATEEEFAHRIKDGKYQDKPPHIAILPDGIISAFSHVGVSRQGGAHDTFLKRKGKRG